MNTAGATDFFCSPKGRHLRWDPSSLLFNASFPQGKVATA